MADSKKKGSMISAAQKSSSHTGSESPHRNQVENHAHGRPPNQRSSGRLEAELAVAKSGSQHGASTHSRSSMSLQGAKVNAADLNNNSAARTPSSFDQSARTHGWLADQHLTRRVGQYTQLQERPAYQGRYTPAASTPSYRNAVQDERGGRQPARAVSQVDDLQMNPEDFMSIGTHFEQTRRG